MKDTTNYDLILKGYPELEKYQLIIEKSITMYRKKDDLLKQEIVTKKSKRELNLNQLVIMYLSKNLIIHSLKTKRKVG